MQDDPIKKYGFVLFIVAIGISLILSIISLVISKMNQKNLNDQIQKITKEISNIAEKGITTEQEQNIVNAVQNAIMSDINPKFDTINANIQDINSTSVKNNQQYYIHAIAKNGWLSDQGGAQFKGMAKPGDWEKMQFVQA